MVNVSKMRSKSVSSFVNSLRSSGSKKNYYSTLKSFFEHISPGLKDVPDKIRVNGKDVVNPDKVQAIDEVSIEYVRDAEVKTMTGEIDYEEDLRRFRDDVLRDHAGSTKKYKFRVIFRYLKANQIEFDSTFMTNMLGRGRPVTAIVEKIPTPTQFDKILDRIDPAGRAAILLMAKAGMRPEEAIGVKLRDLDLDYTAEFVDSDTGEEKSVRIAKINIPMAKGEQPRFTLLIGEVEQALREWLVIRNDYIIDLKKKLHYHDKDVDESQVFPYGEKTIRSMWVTALKRCGLDQREDLTLRGRLVYRLHGLRKYFRTYGSWRNPDIPECLMGHQSGMSKIYSQPQKAIELLVKGIREAEKRLSSRRLRTEDLDDLREEVEGLREMNAIMAEQLGEMASLKDRIKELESYFEVKMQPPQSEDDIAELEEE